MACKENVMKKFAVLSISIAIALFVSGVLGQSAEPVKDHDKPARDHRWLQQLVGEWDVQYKVYMQPDQPPSESAGTDSVRTVGDHWVIADTKSTMMGDPFNGVLSLGYDSRNKRFNATWIDSMGGHLWVYKGTLSDAGDTLTLETEGPSMQDLDKTARYKETITITGENSRTFTSIIELEGGAWVEILSAQYRRKK
jgi:hypothetical protein